MKQTGELLLPPEWDANMEDSKLGHDIGGKKYSACFTRMGQRKEVHECTSSLPAVAQWLEHLFLCPMFLIC